MIYTEDDISMIGRTDNPPPDAGSFKYKNRWDV